MLGHGFLLFGQAYPPRAVGGAALAVCAMVAYTKFNLLEQGEQRQQAGAAARGGRGSEEPLAAAEQHEGAAFGEAVEEPKTPLMSRAERS